MHTLRYGSEVFFFLVVKASVLVAVNQTRFISELFDYAYNFAN